MGRYLAIRAPHVPLSSPRAEHAVLARIGSILVAACGSPAAPIDAATPVDALVPIDAFVAPVDSGPAPGMHYETSFDLDESPLSESGHWTNVALDWTNVITSGGLAYGTQDNDGGFDDSYARLSGSWPADQEVSAIVHKGTTSGIMEVELHVRVTESAHSVQLYEVNFAHDGQYVDFIRWHGPLGTRLEDFTYLVPSLTYRVAGGIHDGDELRVTIVGDLITAYVNDLEVGHANDGTLTGGNPGIGFYRSNGAEMSEYCFTSFAARSL